MVWGDRLMDDGMTMIPWTTLTLFFLQVIEADYL